MAYDVRRYRNWYAKLLRLYPHQHYARFGEGMQQTFNDLLRERTRDGRGVFDFALWMFVETSVGIIQENITCMILTKRTLVFVFAAPCLLFVPFFAMQFNVDGWDWHLTDFVIMAVLLSSAGAALAAATNNTFPLQRRLIGLAIVGLLFILYVHLAVGIADCVAACGKLKHPRGKLVGVN